MRTRDEVLEIVLKNMRLNVPDLEHVEIDPSRSMIEYGATSLDLMEIVSCTLRELQVRVPRRELAGLQNIEQLVDLLWERQQPQQVASLDG